MVKLHVQVTKDKWWVCEKCGSFHRWKKKAELCETYPTTPFLFEVGQEVKFDYRSGVELIGVIIEQTRSHPPFDQKVHANFYIVRLHELYEGCRHVQKHESSLKLARETREPEEALKLIRKGKRVWQ